MAMAMANSEKNKDSAPARGLPLPLLSINHISLNCRSLPRSIEFYTKVLGFQLVRRPASFTFQGAWLFSYGIGIHLLECKSLDFLPKRSEVDPRDNHISFQCPDMEILEETLKDNNVKYVKRVVEDGGINVDQMFLHDPDGYVIELCNCENFPVVPITAACPLKRMDDDPVSLQSVASWASMDERSLQLTVQ